MKPDSPNQASRVFELYEQLQALPRDRREAELERLTADDPSAVRAEVMRMLGIKDRGTASELLDPNKTRVDGDGSSLPLPDRIDEYTIQSRIGEGGMGEVLLAHQESNLQRKVALKLIRESHTSSRILQRFKFEQQTLAMMQHPGIVPVFDAGDYKGRPWFAMEYVDGKGLIRHCDEHQLDIRERLELFLQVCDAVHYAHQKAVIHRDLKPSNILVANDTNDQPRIKVIDFGVAKAVETDEMDGPERTQFGQVIGTLEYMSPEQIQGSLDIDITSDIYALGVTLYELLVGEPPFPTERFRTTGTDSMKQAISKEEACKPSERVLDIRNRSLEISDELARYRSASPNQLVKLLRRDLDWIPLKAIAKDRHDRYSTAESLGKDIRRYLDGLPLEAGPSSRLAKMNKFVARNKWQTSSAAAILVLVIAMIFLALYTLQTRNEHKQANIDHIDTLNSNSSTALASDIQNFEQGHRNHQKALDLALDIYSPGQSKLAEQIAQMGDFYFNNSKYLDDPTKSRALEPYKKALDVLSDRSPLHLELVMKHGRASSYDPSDDSQKQAQADFEFVIRNRDSMFGKDHESSCDARMELARLYFNQEAYENSLSILTEAIGQRTEKHSLADNNGIEMMLLRFETLRKLGDTTEANATLEELMNAVVVELGPSHPTTAFLINRLIRIQQAE